MQPTLNPTIASSTDPTQVANWIKGLILSLSSVITYLVLAFFHINLTPATLDQWATGIGMIIGAIWFVYGSIHHGVALVGRTTAPKRGLINIGVQQGEVSQPSV